MVEIFLEGGLETIRDFWDGELFDDVFVRLGGLGCGYALLSGLIKEFAGKAGYCSSKIGENEEQDGRGKRLGGRDGSRSR